MCIFSQKVNQVSDTAIFARGENDGRQFLAYQMQVALAGDTAMVLPLPVRPDSSEDAVEFINLAGYPSFFNDLAKGFPVPAAMPAAQLTTAVDSASLRVHEVGDFEASYVPTQQDWHRLDRRFRLPEVVWSAIPSYAEYGFAVFKLKAARKGWFRRGRTSTVRKVHPMAFTFPRREPARLFYPTVHVHDGQLNESAHFDHLLYAQSPGIREKTLEKEWRKSAGPASSFMSVELSEGMIAPELYCYRRRIWGMAPNIDVWIGG